MNQDKSNTFAIFTYENESPKEIIQEIEAKYLNVQKIFLSRIGDQYGLPMNLTGIQIQNIHKNSVQRSNTLTAVIGNFLNLNFNLNLSNRSWRLLLGQWTYQLCVQIEMRSIAIEKVLKYDPLVSIITRSQTTDFMVRDTSQLMGDIGNPNWEVYFYEEIIRANKTNFVYYQKTHCTSPDAQNLHFEKKRLRNSIKHNLKAKILKVFGIWRKTGIITSNTYLSLKDEMLLHLKLGSKPLLPVTQSHTVICRNANFRNEIKRILRGSSDPFLSKFSNLISDFFPASMLENFSWNLDQSEKMMVINKPQVIFTSNSFSGDDLFNLMVARATEKGSTYIVAQHGNNYGTRINMENAIEIETPDWFLTWGWTSESKPNVIPFFNIKVSRSRMRAKKNKSEFLLVTNGSKINNSLYNSVDSVERDIQNETDLVLGLEEHLLDHLVIRAYKNDPVLIQGFKLKDIPQDKIRFDDYFKNSFVKEIRKYSIVVFMYDSTGFLETISSGVPSVFFSDNQIPLTKRAITMYESLAESGVWFTDVHKLALFLNNNHSHFGNWWKESRRQQIIQEFISNFSRISTNLSSDLAMKIEQLEALTRSNIRLR